MALLATNIMLPMTAAVKPCVDQAVGREGIGQGAWVGVCQSGTGRGWGRGSAVGRGEGMVPVIMGPLVIIMSPMMPAVKP